MSKSFSSCATAVTIFVLLTVAVSPASLMELTGEEKGLKLTPTKEMVIFCNVSSASLNVKWFKDGRAFPWFSDDKRVNAFNSTTKDGKMVSQLSIKSASEADLGVYRCQIAGDSNTSKNVRIYLPADVKAFPAKSFNLEEGETLTLECEIFGYPIPKVKWFKATEEGQPGVELQPDDEDERITIEMSQKNVTDGRLKIANLTFEDRAYYRCEASNEYATAKASTLVRVKGKLAALWPFLGICAEVIILVIIIFCYERKRAKNAEDDDDDTPVPTSRSTGSGKGDVRQRK